MRSLSQSFAAMARSRLCRRMALAIFLCLVFVVGAILVPAYRDLERGMLGRLEEQGGAVLVSLFRSKSESVTASEASAAAQSLTRGTVLTGGAFYTPGGIFVARFGEEATPLREIRPDMSSSGRYRNGGTRWEVVWPESETGAPYLVVARLDSSRVAMELRRFLLRAGAISLMAVVVVTSVAMALLWLTILAPILDLRRRLAAAGAELEHADRHTMPVERADELGDVLHDFNRLLSHVSGAIADMRRSHFEVRESEERWHRIFDGSTEAILLFDPVGRRIEDANETALGLFGYSRGELLQLPIEALDNSGDGTIQRLLETASREGRAAGELICASHDGRRIVAEAHLATLPVGRRRPILLMARDITARRTAEEALRLSQRRLAGILDIAEDAIVTVDEHRIVRLFNKGAEAIFGHLAGEAIGKPLELLLPHGVPSLPGTGSDGSVAGDRSQRRIAERTEVTARRKDGSEFPAELSAATLRLGGEIVSTIILRDITERRQAEAERADLLAQFHQAQKMEAIGRLAGGISHDFNNVLAAILGYADLALDDLPVGHPARGNVEQVLKAGRRGKSLVRQILAFSRREERSRSTVRLDQTLSETLELLTAALPRTIEIRRRIERPLTTVLGDDAELHQVIMNLCLNAAQAIGHEPGAIEVELAPVEVTGEGIGGRDRGKLVAGALKPGRYVRLRVADTGVGMDERTLSRMFEPFFTTKPKGEGTGLGLAAVHGIVTGQGGAIAVRSAPGKGTRVDVYLPSGSGQTVDPVETGEPAPGGGERLLLVDDEPDLVEIGRKSLERLGYRVDAMTSSMAALRAFEAAPDRWSLVVIDHVMPALTGERMARAMLRMRPDLPIVMCTGYGEAISADMAKAAGIREFVLKPLVGRDLGRMVRRLLDEAAQAVTTS